MSKKLRNTVVILRDGDALEVYTDLDLELLLIDQDQPAEINDEIEVFSLTALSPELWNQVVDYHENDDD